MTCVVGIVHDSTIHMGADTASAQEAAYHVNRRADPKVFTVGEFTLGFTTSYRMGQLLAHALKIPPLPRGGPTHKWMVTKFIDAMRKCLAAGGWMFKKDNRETAGTFLVGVRGRLYQVSSDHGVAEPGLPYAAIGCGYAYALGSLFATAGLPLAPWARIEAALAAAAEFSAYVRRPFTILPA